MLLQLPEVIKTQHDVPAGQILQGSLVTCLAEQTLREERFAAYKYFSEMGVGRVSAREREELHTLKDNVA